MSKDTNDFPGAQELFASVDCTIAATDFISFAQALPSALIVVFPESNVLWGNREYWKMIGIFAPDSTVVGRDETGCLQELSEGGWLHHEMFYGNSDNCSGVARIQLPANRAFAVNIDLRFHSADSDNSNALYIGTMYPLQAESGGGGGADTVYRMRYEKLFNQMQEGFAVHEVICDRNGNVVDYRFLSVNPAFEQITGMCSDGIIGKTVKEVMPDIEDFWIKRYGEVALTGRAANFKQYSKVLDRHFWVNAYQTSPGNFACFIIDITSQVSYEKALRAKNEEWLDTFDAVPEMIAILDNDCNIIHYNEAFADAVGIAGDRLIGMKCYEVFHETSGMPLICPLRKLFADGKKHESSFYEEHLGMYLDVSVSPLKDGSGAVIGSVHVARDVTKKKQIEQALVESESKFRLLFENMNIGFVLLEMSVGDDDDFEDCVCLEVNPAGESILGISSENLVGKRLKEVYPDIWGEWYTAGGHVIRTGISKMIDYYVDALKRYFQIWLFSAGKNHVAVLFSDVSATMIANEQLRLKSAAIEASFNGIAISDTAGKIIYANAAFLKIWGFPSLEQALGNSSLPFVDSPGASSSLRCTVETGLWRGVGIQSCRLDNAEERPGGEVITNVSMSLIDNAQHGHSYIISIVLDVTMQKRLEAEASQRREQLIHADKLATVGTLVACIMHEINNPVGVISLNTPILQSVWQSLQPRLDELAEVNSDLCIGNTPYAKIRDYIPQLLSGILDGTERITRIIKRLKDFSRPESTEQKTEIDVNSIVRNSVHFLDSHIRKSTRNFSMELADNLVTIPQGYPHRIEQVVVNVLMNACQALQDSSRGISISTSYDSGKDCLRIIVVDEGCGIESKNIENLATPFFTTKRDTGGSGLGLSVCNSILKEHGGWLEFESESGKGTTVRIILPVK